VGKARAVVRGSGDRKGGQRMMRPGMQVIRLGFKGTGQVVGIDGDGLCEVFWQRSRKRECHPESDLVWCGLTLYTFDGRSAKVIQLGYNKILVRLENGNRCWMGPDEIAPREPKQQDVGVE
jgi:hypothetical protein